MTAITMNIPLSVDRTVIRMMQSTIDTLPARAANARQIRNSQADIRNVHELAPHLLRDIGIIEDQILEDLVNNPHKGSI